MRFRGTDARRTLIAAGIFTLLAAAPALADDPTTTTPATIAPAPQPVTPSDPSPVTVLPASGAPPYGTTAVVLVSGFDTTSPFTTADPACATQRGPTWSQPGGPAEVLTGAGLAVFTAPVAAQGTTAGTCTGSANGPLPPPTATIDSNGDVDANGQALVTLLTFLRTQYGITNVHLVGHSDGGLWSRSAITQLTASGASPVTVDSLTTLGTPHTGSFGADLAVALNGGNCSQFSDPVEQDICDAVIQAIQLMVRDLGPTATEQLSNGFLQTWNPQQQIGCSVTVMAGTHVGYAIPLLGYYTPNDGIVGESSALAVESLEIDPAGIIPAPGFTPSDPTPDTFDVVHSAMLTFLTPNTLLNTAAISANVLAAIDAPPSGPCVTGASSALRGSAGPGAAADDEPQADDGPGARAAAATVRAAGAPSTLRARAAFRDLVVADARGTLPRPRRGDAILALPGASVHCGSRELAGQPLLGSRRVSVIVPRCAKRLRVTGRVLALVGDRHRGLTVARSGRALRVEVPGGRLKRMRAHVRIGDRWHAMPVRGTTLPADAGRVAVRVSGRTPKGQRVRATLHVSD